MNDHLTHDDLIALAYGIGDSSHVKTCGPCQERLAAIEQLRRNSTGDVPISFEAMAAQRRAVLARISEPAQTRLPWVPALVAAGLLMVVAIAYRPGSGPSPAAKSVDDVWSDDSLLVEIHSIEQADVPRAVAPIRGLFDDVSVDQFEETN